LRSDAEAKRVLSEFGWSHYIGRGVPRDRKAGEPEGMLQRSVQRHLESGRVVRGKCLHAAVCVCVIARIGTCVRVPSINNATKDKKKSEKGSKNKTAEKKEGMKIEFFDSRRRHCQL